MTKERKEVILKVLKALLEHQEVFSCGLCFWTSNLKWEKIINVSEENIFKSFLAKNIPLLLKNGNYWWEPNHIYPRIKWIEKQIYRLETPWYKRILKLKY